MAAKKVAGLQGTYQNYIMKNFNMTSLELKSFNKSWEMCREVNRLASFKNWHVSDAKPSSAIQMAKAGFVYSGPDSATCFLCDKHLDCWDEDDDPWKEHIKHSSTCNFAKQNTEELYLTARQLIEFQNELLLKLVKKILAKKGQELQDSFNKRINKLKK